MKSEFGCVFFALIRNIPNRTHSTVQINIESKQKHQWIVVSLCLYAHCYVKMSTMLGKKNLCL